MEFAFTPVQGAKTQVRVTPSRLKTRSDVEDLKEGWSWALDSLRSYLETGTPIRHAEWKRGRLKR